MAEKKMSSFVNITGDSVRQALEGKTIHQVIITHLDDTEEVDDILLVLDNGTCIELSPNDPGGMAVYITEQK
jgi:hypothetical protein